MCEQNNKMAQIKKKKYFSLHLSKITIKLHKPRSKHDIIKQIKNEPFVHSFKLDKQLIFKILKNRNGANSINRIIKIVVNLND